MIRHFRPFLLVVVLSISSGSVFAQAVPVFTAPTSKVGGAIGQGIAQNLIRRGFAANDPRILETVSGISSRMVGLSAARSGVSLAIVAADMVPWVLAGVAVYQGVTWYFDNQGKAYLAPPGSTTSTNVYSNGVYNGATVYYLSNAAGYLAGSIQEAYSALVARNKASYPDASYGVPTITQTNTTTWSVKYTYSIPSQYLNNQSASITAYSQAYTGSKVCAAGTVLDTGKGTCADAAMSSGPYAGSTVQGYSLPDAYSNLPANVKAAAMSPDLAAELANRAWQNAAAQPGYKGLPFPSSNPVANSDLAPYQSAHPDYWPATNSLADAVPTTGSGPLTVPVAVPAANYGPTTSTGTTTGTITAPDGSKSTTSSTTTIDWGEFTPPDLDTPTIESILDPLFSMWPSWQHFAFPSHSSVCPTPSFTLPVSVMGGYTINFTQLCTWTETVRPTMQACFAVAWAILIVFIVMGA